MDVLNSGANDAVIAFGLGLMVLGVALLWLAYVVRSDGTACGS